MSQDTPQIHISRQFLVYEMAGTDAVRVRHDECPGRDGTMLAMDLYDPSDRGSGSDYAWRYP